MYGTQNLYPLAHARKHGWKYFPSYLALIKIKLIDMDFRGLQISLRNTSVLRWRHTSAMASQINGKSVVCSTACWDWYTKSKLRITGDRWTESNDHQSTSCPPLMWTKDAWSAHILWSVYYNAMMTSWNGNIFRVTGPLCGEFTGPGEFPAQRPVTLDVFFDLRLNERLSKPTWGWWF